jgi:ParB-like chromosome segregation protein Spo0J
LAQVVLDRSAWPRFTWDLDRIELFKGLVASGEEVPPIEVVRREDGKFIIADGVHRAVAARWAGRNDIEALVLDPADGESLLGFAYRRALETATRTALPLTKDERRRAVRRLLAESSDLSHRSIAKLVGVSHDTVDRWAKDEATSNESEPERMTPFETSARAARRLASAFVRLDESRGLLDTLRPSRMGSHLADALADRLGDDALDRAQAYAQWSADAFRVLEDRYRPEERT